MQTTVARLAHSRASEDRSFARFDGVVSQGFKQQLIEHVPQLRAFAYSLTRDPASADDLVQEVMLKAWRAKDNFDGVNMHAWLFRILRNTFYNDEVIRRRSVQDVDGAIAARLPSAPDQEWRLRWAEMLQALERLRPHAREALLLVTAAGLSYEDAAAVCNCPVGTMKSRVKRAREALAAMIDFDLPEAVERRCA